MRSVYSIGIRNGANERLDNCQAQLQIITTGADIRPHHFRHFICSPFSLRPDEVAYKQIFEWDIDVQNAPLRIIHYTENNGAWITHSNNLALMPGEHRLNIEVLSANSRMAIYSISLNHNGRTWTMEPTQINDG